MTGPSLLPLTLDDIRLERDGQWLIDGISLDFEAGPLSVIVGPNGAGKSLLLRLCHGLIDPTSGHVGWAVSRDLPGVQAMVFQKPVLLRRPVLANVEYPLKLRGVPRPKRRARALEALELTGLTAFAERSARVLSGGEQQRLAIARAWVLEPEVLFLDEPTASLDPAATREVERLIRRIHAAGTKIIMTSHRLDQVRRLADEVLLLLRGRVVERAAAGRFFDDPQTREARAFIAGELVI